MLGEAKDALLWGGRRRIWFLLEGSLATTARPDKSKMKENALDWLDVAA